MSLDGRSRARATTSRGGEEVSDLDKRIIEHLQQDGRRPFTQIASALGISERHLITRWHQQAVSLVVNRK